MREISEMSANTEKSDKKIRKKEEEREGRVDVCSIRGSVMSFGLIRGGSSPPRHS